jgi:CheY-like chemotaxis protein
MRARQVLVVDDDPDVREALAFALGDDGFDVLLAADGAEALSTLAAGAAPRAIVLDLGMPRMNGWQFRDLQKRDPALARIPVVVMTAQPPLGIDAERVIRKPCTLAQLVAAVRHALGPPPRERDRWRS